MMYREINFDKWIWFDCDGTFVDLYGVDGWLDNLIAKDVRPYREAKPMYNMVEFAEMLKTLKANGYKVGVISWLAKNSNKDYDNRVRATKRQWLKDNGLYEIFDSIRITPYGVKKSTTCKKYGWGCLIDDELKNREDWENGLTIDATKNILEELKKLL